VESAERTHIRFILTCQHDKHSRMIHTIRLCWETNFNDYRDVILTIYTLLREIVGEYGNDPCEQKNLNL